MQLHAAPSEYFLKYLRGPAPSLHNSWYLGVVLNLVASFAGALGDNIVRLSFVKERQRTLEATRSLHRRPLWLLGFFLSVIINPLLTVLSLRFAAAAIVLPFGGMHIFWNVLLVGFLLREKLLTGDICGSLCILVGVCLVLFYGPHEAPAYSVASLSALAVQPTFMLYLLAEAVCVVACLAASADLSPLTASSVWRPSPQLNITSSDTHAALHFVGASHSQHQLERQEAVAVPGHNTRGSRSSYACGLQSEPASSAYCGEFTLQAAPAARAADELVEKAKLAAPAAGLVRDYRLSALATVQRHVPPWVRRFCVPVLSGMFGGLGNLSAKGLVELLDAQGLRQSFRSSEFVVCLIATLLFCSLQVLYLNRALLSIFSSLIYIVLIALRASPSKLGFARESSTLRTYVKLLWARRLGRGGKQEQSGLGESRHEAKVAVPVINATLIASGSLGGLLLFREYENMSPTRFALFTFGIVFVIGGIAILASAPSCAATMASQPELFASRVEDLHGTDEERQALKIATKA